MKWSNYISSAEVKKSISTLVGAGNLFEVRILGADKKRILSGYFTDVNTLIAAFDTVDVRNTNIYITLNEVNSACYSRNQHDKFLITSTTTQDKEINKYKWLFIDLDPERPTGISSSDDELKAANNKAVEIVDYLSGLGFEEPVKAISGNGFHLLYRIDIPNTAESVELIRNCLIALDNKFSDSVVKIDKANHNPSRICKLHGTLAQKGSSTETRPHRMSRIISEGNGLVTSIEALKYLAGTESVEPVKVQPTAEFDLEDFMRNNGLDIYDERSGRDCRIYSLTHCPFDHNHVDGDSKIFHYSNGAIAFKCHHNSCASKNWQDVRTLFEPDAYTKQDDSWVDSGWKKHKQYTVVSVTDDIEAVKKSIPKLKAISASELQQMEFGERYYSVENMIPEGETVIAAPPKTGKSWLMLDMCLAVAKGEDFLTFPTRQSGTLYLALEDGDSFEQERLNIVLNGEKAPNNFHFVFKDVMQLNSGFLLQLDELLKALPDVKLVVIDTLQFIKHRQGKSESAYECDYRTGRDLKEYADKNHIAIVVVTHTTKMIHIEDDMANVSGTNGVTGAADSVVVLNKKKRTDKEAKMFITGRKVKQTLHKITFNNEVCRWQYDGECEDDEDDELQQRLFEYQNSAIRQAIIDILKRNSSWRGRCSLLIDDSIKVGTPILDCPKNIGTFLSKMQSLFASEDGIYVRIIKNGTGARLYEFSHTKDIQDVTVDNPFELMND